MDDYQFWTLAILMIGAIVTPLLTWLKDRNARRLDGEKMNAVQQSIDALQANLEIFNKNVGKYLKLVKERDEAEFVLKAADLVVRAKG